MSTKPNVSRFAIHLWKSRSRLNHLAESDTTMMIIAKTAKIRSRRIRQSIGHGDQDICHYVPGNAKMYLNFLGLTTLD